MDKKFDSISPEQMKQLASSPAAQALMAMLQQNSSADMQTALAAAQSGDMARVQQSLQAFMADPRAQALIKKLQEETHG